MSRSEVKFITDMIESHGTNYKVSILHCSFVGYTDILIEGMSHT